MHSVQNYYFWLSHQAKALVSVVAQQNLGHLVKLEELFTTFLTNKYQSFRQYFMRLKHSFLSLEDNISKYTCSYGTIVYVS